MKCPDTDSQMPNVGDVDRRYNFVTVMIPSCSLRWMSGEGKAPDPQRMIQLYNTCFLGSYNSASLHIA